MKKSDIKACVMRIEGTNCEDETKRAFQKLGVNAEIVHLKQLTKGVSKERRRNLFKYHILIFPGGFSAGDYVTSGAIWSARVKGNIYNDLKKFVKEGRPVGGICNGFQVLMNLGFLDVEAALTVNESALFECRPAYIKKLNECAFTEHIEKDMVLSLPVAHAEGRFVLAPDKERKGLKTLEENDQIIFKYTKADGEPANGAYPWNPNGSFADIAGICNLERNVFGMMPHPERALENFEQHDWARKQNIIPEGDGEGTPIFKSVIEYVLKRF